MKKTCLFTIIFLLALMLVSCQNSENKSSSSSGKITIGVALPLSGSMAEYGQNAKEGITLAKEDLSRANKSLSIDLIFSDTQDTPNGTVNSVRRLIDVDHVKFIIGGLTSSGVLAAAPYAQARGTLFFTPAASAPGIPEIGNMIFRNWQSDTLLATLAGGDAYKKFGMKSMAIISVSNDYGKTNSEYFEKAFSKAGGKVIFKRSFPQGSSDFKGLVTQLRAIRGLNGILIVAYPEELINLYREIATQGLPGVQLFATDTFYSPKLLGELGSSAENTICIVAAKPDDEYLPRKNFVAAYEKRFKNAQGEPKKPGLVSDTAYDAFNLLVKGILETDGSPASVSRWLLKVKDYPGVSGKTTFTQSGDIIGSISYYRVVHGKFVSVGK
jgi:branched-chain amino acid transport system substrate-binding protein